jgi:6-phosphogluconolactonase
MDIENLVYVGTYTEAILFGTGQVLQGQGKGIHSFVFDPEAGTLTPHLVTENVRNPSYLCLSRDRAFLYCVNEYKEYDGQPSGGVSAFAIDGKTGALRFLNSKPSHGTDPCHLITDPSGRYLSVANFASGSTTVLPILADGSLGDESCWVQHQGSSVHPVRQTGPHAHAVEFSADGRFAYVPDLGKDEVIVFAFDARNGTLAYADVPKVTCRPGAGPRQLAMHPKGGFAYLINELDSTMTAFRHDAATGALSELQTLSTLPADFTGVSTCAEVQITPDGRFLYGSNRGHDSLAIFAIDPGRGTMTPVGWEPSGGRIPRNFAIDPTGRYLCAANQDTSNLVLFRIDQDSGKLTRYGTGAQAGTPICVRFA